LTSPSTIYVDDDNVAGPWDGSLSNPYQNITSALENALDDDTIFVFNGTYSEDLVVEKRVSLHGESIEGTTIDGTGTTNTIYVILNGVEITNFTVTNSGTDYPYSGIFLDNVQDSRVLDNNVSFNNGIGIFVAWGSNNTILHNIASHNGQVGIRVDGHNSPALLENNTIEYNQLDGIFTYNAHDVIIQENTISNNGQNGISLEGTSLNITVRNNLIESNAWHGIGLVSDTSYCNILGNNITANTQDGINLFMADNNKISENNVVSNGWDGLYIAQCSDNTIGRNNLTDNGEGVKLKWSSGLTIIGNNRARGCSTV
jgi:parallel beta-helix repeat protein